MLNVVYCKCGSTDLHFSKPGEDGRQGWFCPDCESEGEVAGVVVSGYHGAHEGDVRNKSAPGRSWLFSEVEEWERYPQEEAAGEEASGSGSARDSLFTRLSGAVPLAADPVQCYQVSESDITVDAVEGLSALLDSGANEFALQQYLESNRGILVQLLRGGHGRYVIPHPRLGTQHVPDFIIGERASFGYDWLLVEIENPKRPLFTKDGEIAEYLRHAMRQVADWRLWLSDNPDYARRPPDRNGLGLIDIEPDASALIIIGRRGDLDPEHHRRRNRLQYSNSTMIRTWDWLVEVARRRADPFGA